MRVESRSLNAGDGFREKGSQNRPGRGVGRGTKVVFPGFGLPGEVLIKGPKTGLQYINGGPVALTPTGFQIILYHR